MDGGGAGLDGAALLDARRPTVDGNFDPFDPTGSCGHDTVPTERVPGSLLLVYDRSGSMADPVVGDRGPSKWSVSGGAINRVLTTLPDDANVGMLLFPESGGADCDVHLSASVPQVPVGPLGTTRGPIGAALSETPNGNATPFFDALRAGWDYLDLLDTPGQRGLVLVTDGAENCDNGDRDEVLALASTQRESKGYLTFVVGLNHSDADLSTLAYNGGTPRSPDCIPQCAASTCFDGSDCPSGAPCNKPDLGPLPPPIPIPGTCGCVTAEHCPSGHTCEHFVEPPPPWPPFIEEDRCVGTATCCHYNATESTFEADFEAVLEEISARLLDSCVFDLPRGSDPTMFSPDQVNVGVTFEGEERTVLPRSSDEGTSSWNFTTPDHESIVIQGEICDRLLMGSADVEIVLGCPTILI